MKATKAERKKIMSDTYSGLAYYALTSQTLLIGYPERCSADPDKLEDIGVSVGAQVRIVHDDNGKKGLATVIQARDESPSKKVRMCKDGRRRWDDDGDNFDCEVDKNCLRSNLTDTQAESQSELVERLDETGTSHTGLVVCAPHGGMVERYTDEQAERVYSQMSATEDVSCWRCKGWRSGGGAYDAWHITSTEISRNSFPLLDQIGDRSFSHAVSFHGYSEGTIAVGGGASTAEKEAVAEAIQDAVGEAYEVEVVSSGPYGGVSEDNFVNWLSANGGVQIEQPYGARSNYGEAIADAVAAYYASIL